MQNIIKCFVFVGVSLILISCGTSSVTTENLSQQIEKTESYGTIDQQSLGREYTNDSNSKKVNLPSDEFVPYIDKK